MRPTSNPDKFIWICILLTLLSLPAGYLLYAAFRDNKPETEASVETVTLLPAADPVITASATPTPLPAATPTPSPTPAAPFTMPAAIREELAPQLIRAKCSGASARDLQAILDDMALLDAASASRWESILDYWTMVNEDGFTNLFDGVSGLRDAAEAEGIHAAAFDGMELLPAGLPKDDSLCFVVLGFSLNADGTPREELIDRLITVIGCTREYPDAYILLTGGPTAYGNAAATEAGAMAEWLMAHGIDEGRLIIENRSLITYDNAAFSYEILRRDYPQVQTLAIVSSDYHIPLGCLLFEAQCLLHNSGRYDLHVRANVGCVTDGYYHFDISSQGSQLKPLAAYE
ncbi:MAG: YdcF family protein [Lachnospiraceae bacterium]|nr:YdcF family protein [Lachnospiraceae bacterium]